MNYKGYIIFTLLVLCVHASSLNAQSQTNNFIAHSHNDYEQPIPLHTALSHGFSSLEVDIWIHEGQLVVCHDKEELSTAPSLLESYLEPLIASLNKIDRRLYLLVDIKDPDYQTCIDLLKQELSPYKEYLINRQNKKGQLQILLSGDLPISRAFIDSLADYLFLDGRVAHIDEKILSETIPWISINFRDVCKWYGKQRPTKNELNQIINFIEKVHAQNMKVRFWNIPSTTLAWHTLIAIGVDIINVDDLEGFHKATSFIK